MQGVISSRVWLLSLQAKAAANQAANDVKKATSSH